MLLGRRFMASETRRIEIAIIGDHFMLPETFEQAIRDACGDALAIHTMRLPFPDEPMEHDDGKPGMAGLEEYQGDPDKIVGFVDKAEVLATHLAPVSAAMLDRMPGSS
jgi:D-3-phosphoglycerate dehydrogenase